MKIEKTRIVELLIAAALVLFFLMLTRNYEQIVSSRSNPPADQNTNFPGPLSSPDGPFYGMHFVEIDELAAVKALGVEVVLRNFAHDGPMDDWLTYLDAAHSQGIKVVAWLWPQGWQWNGQEWEIDAQAELFIRSLAGHPALMAVYALHEPYWRGCVGCGYTTAEQQALYTAIKEIAEVPVWSAVDSMSFWTAQGTETAFAAGICDYCLTWYYPFREDGTYNHIINEKNRLFISGYGGRDVFGNPFARMAFGNQTYSLRWNHLLSEKLFSNFTLIHSRYDYELGTPEGDANAFLWESSMRDYSGKADLSYYITPEHTLKFGLTSTYHDFMPGSARGLGEEALFTEFTLPSNYALENGIYASAESSVGDRLNIRYGMRFSSFHNIGKATVYNYDSQYEAVDSTVYVKGDLFHSWAGWEPRMAVSFLLDENSSIKASYSRTRQYVHLAQNSTAGTPLDIWFPSSPNVKPQVSDQVATGYFRNFLDDMLEVSVEAYYKKMNNTIDFKDHASLLLNTYMEGELRIGQARSYGVEFLLRKDLGKLTGWLSYTLSKTYRKVDLINNGKAYVAPYDKPHDFALVLNYEFSKRLWVSANWVYSTGLPVTFPTGRFEYLGSIAPVYSNRNAYRMPDYHRLDASVSLRSKEKEGRRWRSEWNLSVYNAYARKNAWAINFVQDEKNPEITYAEMTYLFSIIPALTYNFYF